MYCPKCRNVFEESACPVCRNRKVREPAPDDLCFLTEEGPLLGGMLEDVLKQNGIPVLTESSKGAALSVISGQLFEWIRYYVRYEHLPQAKEIVGEVLHASAEAGADDAEEDAEEAAEEDAEDTEDTEA